MLIMKQMAVVPLLLLCISACGKADESSEKTNMPAADIAYSAPLIFNDGKPAGQAKILQAAENSKIAVTLPFLNAGVYALHLHDIGKCETPDFKTAGGHWNPNDKEHGAKNPKGPHAGDLANLTVEEDGPVSQEFDLTAEASAHLPSLIDEDGAAVMMHAEQDDLKSDPAGNAGSRIICGVLASD